MHRIELVAHGWNDALATINKRPPSIESRRQFCVELEDKCDDLALLEFAGQTNFWYISGVRQFAIIYQDEIDKTGSYDHIATAEEFCVYRTTLHPDIPEEGIHNNCGFCNAPLYNNSGAWYVDGVLIWDTFFCGETCWKKANFALQQGMGFPKVGQAFDVQAEWWRRFADDGLVKPKIQFKRKRK